MPAVISNADESSTGHSPQPVSEKLDDPLAIPDNVAKVSRTNGNVRRGSDKDEGDADTEEEPSIKHKRMSGAAPTIHSRRFRLPVLLQVSANNLKCLVCLLWIYQLVSLTSLWS